MIVMGDDRLMNLLVLLSILLLLSAQLPRLRPPWPRVLLIGAAICLGAAILGVLVMR